MVDRLRPRCAIPEPLFDEVLRAPLVRRMLVASAKRRLATRDLPLPAPVVAGALVAASLEMRSDDRPGPRP